MTTTKSAQCRFNKHVSEALNTNENRYFLNAIRKYGRDSFKIEQIDFAYTIEELKQKEINYISLLKATDRKIGYNISLGGDGTPGVLKSKETRERMRNKALGRKWSNERKNNFSKLLKCSGRDFKSGKENLKNYNIKTSKKINQYNINGDLIKSFNSISELINFEKIDRAGIWRYLKTDKFENKKTYKGFLYQVVQ